MFFSALGKKALESGGGEGGEEFIYALLCTLWASGSRTRPLQVRVYIYDVCSVLERNNNGKREGINTMGENKRLQNNVNCLLI